MFKLINIDRSRLIFGNVFATKVYIPKKHLSEQYTNLHCINWFKKIISKYIRNTNTIRYVVLVKRNTRNFSNFEEIRTKIDEFSKQQNLELLIHDDSNLPSLIEQLNIFNQSKYIFSPHGATGILIPAMRPDSWYIEFIKEEWYTTLPRGGGENMARIAYGSSINYYMVSSKGDEVKLEKLINIIDKLMFN